MNRSKNTPTQKAIKFEVFVSDTPQDIVVIHYEGKYEESLSLPKNKWSKLFHKEFSHLKIILR
jgi:hypothetical protein